MSKSTPLSGTQETKELDLGYDPTQWQPKSGVSPKTGKPFRKQTPLQSLSSELNWDLAQVRGASHQLQKLAHKYKVIFPKIFFKDIHAADIAVAIEKEIAERIKIARAERTKEIKEKAALDIKPST